MQVLRALLPPAPPPPEAATLAVLWASSFLPGTLSRAIEWVGVENHLMPGHGLAP